jgi:hypothetical protein
MMAAVLAAATTFVLGMVAGAAAQRWGDGARSPEHLGTTTTYAADVEWAAEMAVVDDDDGAP